MTRALLLDEMLAGEIAAQLRARGHGVEAVVEDPSLVAIDDESLLGLATSRDRCLVTLNIKDFARLDRKWKAEARQHAGLLFVSTSAFPQDRSFIGCLVTSLDVMLTEDRVPRHGAVDLLSRAS